MVHLAHHNNGVWEERYKSGERTRAYGSKESPTTLSPVNKKGCEEVRTETLRDPPINLDTIMEPTTIMVRVNYERKVSTFLEMEDRISQRLIV